MPCLCPDIDLVEDIHKRTVEISGGGTLGQLELTKLESVLSHIQNDDYYPTFEDKLTHLFFCVCKFHCFLDGNKRLALALSTQVLLMNGYLRCARTFLQDMENISYHVANGNIDKNLLREIIVAQINQDMDDEALKLKIVNATSGHDS